MSISHFNMVLLSQLEGPPWGSEGVSALEILVKLYISLSLSLYIYIYIYSIHIYTYIYIYRERERGREVYIYYMYVCIYIYIYIYTHTSSYYSCINMYIDWLRTRPVALPGGPSGFISRSCGAATVSGRAAACPPGWLLGCLAAWLAARLAARFAWLPGCPTGRQRTLGPLGRGPGSWPWPVCCPSR